MMQKTSYIDTKYFTTFDYIKFTIDIIDTEVK